MDVREFLDTVEKAVLKSLDKTKDAVTEAKIKTADALEEMENIITHNGEKTWEGTIWSARIPSSASVPPSTADAEN